MLANLQTTMVPFRTRKCNTVKRMYQENEIADLEDFTTFRANIYKTVKLQQQKIVIQKKSNQNHNV